MEVFLFSVLFMIILGKTDYVCFVYSAYHGHVSSLIDISPYKFRHASDAELNQSVHVVSAFPACLHPVKTKSLSNTPGLWQTTEYSLGYRKEETEVLFSANSVVQDVTKSAFGSESLKTQVKEKRQNSCKTLLVEIPKYLFSHRIPT